jgi:hypothetical protein
MSVLSLRIDGTIAVVESITRSIADAFGDNMERRNAPGYTSLSAARRDKILEIRRQIASGTYDVDGRLDVILERVLTDIT